MSRRYLPLAVEGSIRRVADKREELAAAFDRRVSAESADRPPTCSKGCSSCCYHPILITILEAIPLYRWLSETGRWTTRLRVALEESADRQRGVAYEVWLLSLQACPLLTDGGLCSAYEARPLICRTYVATSDPYYCHPHRIGSETKLVDRSWVTEAYHAEQAKVLRTHNVRLTGLPIGQALLLAERVCEGELPLEDVDAEVLRDYSENG